MIIFLHIKCMVSLPYIEATIRESMRHETLLPSLIPHTSMADSKFGGYDVPKVEIKSLKNSD